MSSLNQSYIGLRKDVLQHVQGKGKVILDVGCATGVNGKYLLENQIASTVYGIEFDEKMSTIAANSGIKVFKGDLNNSLFRKKIIIQSPAYDYILFADILEHLLEPEIVLREFLIILKPGGKVIISLPNIAHIETFIQLYIKGTWPNNSRGIFDRTHLRWFTKKDACKMIEDAGLTVTQYIPNLRARDALGSQFNWKYNLVKWINKDLVTFQHLLICSHAD